MADPNLCDDTFSVWMALLGVSTADETMLMIDQTFALIVQHWLLFSEETQLLANKTVIGLTQKYEPQVRARIEYLPSLADIPMLSKTEAELVRFKGRHRQDLPVF
jgi:serine/threonine-protein kinase ATR